MSWRRIIDSSAVAIGLIAAFGIAYALIARFVLHGVPFSGDEYSMSLQGELFAHGMLKAPAPQHAEWLRVDHVIIDDWVRSKYPVGAPALLSFGHWIGAPWLVIPVQATITLAIVWLTIRRLYGAPTALAGVVLLGMTPLYIVNATSFLAHIPALMFLALAFWAITSWLYERKDRWLIVAGVAIGCAFLVRPFDALLFGVAMTALRSWRALIITAVAAIPCLGLHLLYQDMQFGSPLMDGYKLYEPTFRSIYGDIGASSLGLDQFLSARQQSNHFDILENMLFGATVLGAPLMAIIGSRRADDGPQSSIRTFSIALILIFVLALLFTLAEPDDAPRARYLTVPLLPLTVLGANGLRIAWSSANTRLFAILGVALVAFSFAFAVNSTVDSMKYHAFQIWHRTGPARLGEKLPANAIIIIRATFPTRYARNGPFFDGRLYLSVPSNVSDDAVRAAYPDRPIYSAREAQPWKFRRVQ